MDLNWSPSVWRVWIEISICAPAYGIVWSSPSVWRVWIEILTDNIRDALESLVTLRVEGVD